MTCMSRFASQLRPHKVWFMVRRKNHQPGNGDGMQYLGPDWCTTAPFCHYFYLHVSHLDLSS